MLRRAASLVFARAWQTPSFAAVVARRCALQTATAHSLIAAQIAMCDNLHEAAVFEQAAHCGALVVAMLEQQPGIVVEVPRGSGDDLAQRVQSVGARRERELRLVRQRSEVS